MLIEERCYVLKPEKTVQDFLAIYEKQGLELQSRTLGNMLGFFATEVGELNALVHLWGYENFEDRLRRRTLLAAIPEWQAYLEQVRPMIQSMTNRLLTPTSFSPIR